MDVIPYGRQDISEDDIRAVVEVLRSDFLTQGQVVPNFEESVAKYCGTTFGIATSSATSALHLACLALDIGPGDIVWTSPNSFVASANCALYCGAAIDFVDIDPITYNMSTSALYQKLLEAKKFNKLPKVVIPVHFAGQSCDMRAISMLGKEFGFRVIEDASHALGGRIFDRPVGSCEFSDITVFSFHPVKMITTGEGGMATTNHPEYAKKMRLLRSHGIIQSDQNKIFDTPNEIWKYRQIDLGFNYRMTDVQAALGLSQLSRLDDFVLRRNSIARRYDAELMNLPLFTPKILGGIVSSFHLYVIRIHEDISEISRNKAFKDLHLAGVHVNLHYIPIYLQPFFLERGFKRGYCREAEKYFRGAITLPMFYGLTDKNMTKVIDVVKGLFN